MGFNSCLIHAPKKKRKSFNSNLLLIQKLFSRIKISCTFIILHTKDYMTNFCIMLTTSQIYYGSKFFAKSRDIRVDKHEIYEGIDNEEKFRGDKLSKKIRQYFENNPK